MKHNVVVTVPTTSRSNNGVNGPVYAIVIPIIASFILISEKIIVDYFHKPLHCAQNVSNLPYKSSNLTGFFFFQSVACSYPQSNLLA